MQTDPIVIVSIARTPIGNLLGELKDFSAVNLGTHAIQATVERAGIASSHIDTVYMGCVLPAGLGQAPARQAALHAGIPQTTPCTTINKVCGSAMQAIMFACESLHAGNAKVCVAGGMESMTNAPYLLLKGRQGYRLGKSELYDHMMLDGLEDAYDKGRPMGYFAEQTATQLDISRTAQDEYALRSFQRAVGATNEHLFAEEIVPLHLHTKQGEQLIDKDEHPFSVNPAKIPQLSAIFVKDGSVTAGNSSSIADGAAAIMLMRASTAKKHGLTPLAKIVGHASAAKAPHEFTIAPEAATRELLTKINWQIDEVDLFEVNEAFAVVALAFMQAFNLSADKVNIHGGACALGHPIGASGARIIVTLLAALKQTHLKRGIATLCIGGGEATAIAVEMY